jgi:hypothetical protein
MIEYIQVFEKRTKEELTIKDLIDYSGLSVMRKEHDTTGKEKSL